MDKLTEVQLKLQRMGCPLCFNIRLELVLRCDLGQKGCIYAAKCLHCGNVFEVNTKSEPFEESEPELENKIKTSGCPKWGVMTFSGELPLRFGLSGLFSCPDLSNLWSCVYSGRLGRQADG